MNRFMTAMNEKLDNVMMTQEQRWSQMVCMHMT